MDKFNYFDIIKSLNNLNTSAICPLCLTNRVEVYINPCGHCNCIIAKMIITICSKTRRR